MRLASEFLGSACLSPRARKISTFHYTWLLGGYWESKSGSPAHLASTFQTEPSSQPSGCFPQLLGDRNLLSEGLTRAWQNKHRGSPHETDAAHRDRNTQPRSEARWDGCGQGLGWSRVSELLWDHEAFGQPGNAIHFWHLSF